MSMQPYDRRAAKAKFKTNRQPRHIDVRKVAALEHNARPVKFIGWNPLENNK